MSLVKIAIESVESEHVGQIWFDSANSPMVICQISQIGKQQQYVHYWSTASLQIQVVTWTREIMQRYLPGGKDFFSEDGVRLATEQERAVVLESLKEFLTQNKNRKLQEAQKLDEAIAQLPEK